MSGDVVILKKKERPRASFLNTRLRTLEKEKDTGITRKDAIRTEVMLPSSVCENMAHPSVIAQVPRFICLSTPFIVWTLYQWVRRYESEFSYFGKFEILFIFVDLSMPQLILRLIIL